MKKHKKKNITFELNTNSSRRRNTRHKINKQCGMGEEEPLFIIYKADTVVYAMPYSYLKNN